MKASKKKLILCGLAIMSLPLLVGFKVDGTSDTGDTVTAEKVTEEKVTEEKAGTSQDLGQITEAGANTPQVTVNAPVVENGNINFNQENNSQSDAMFVEYLTPFQDKTVVEVKFEGASDDLLPTVKAAVLLHDGDKFNVNVSMRDRDTLRNMGYFYEVYQTVDEIPEGIILTYHVLENPQVNDIVITGNTVYSGADLRRMVTVRRGTILNSRTLHENITAIQEKYHGDGYVRMKFADMNVSEDGVVTLKISEGTLEGYAVKGNKKTKDYVVLREMRQKVGEVFNAKMARRSMERVYNLGFFEDVNVKMNDGVEPNAVIMEINVKEKRTGTFGIGAGYSSKDGVVGMVSLGDKNFRGTGDAISFSYEKSAEDTDSQGFYFSYRRPWLDRKETSGTVRLFNRTYEYADYAPDGGLNERYMRKYSGGELTISRPMSEYSANQITLRNRKDKYVRHVTSGKYGDRGAEEYSTWRKDNFGTTRSIELQHITDTRDNVFNPTSGGKVSLIGEFAGFLGGDFKFQKYSIEHQQYLKAGDHSQVWALHLAYGIGHGDLTEFNQFRIGGQNSLRGYRDDQFRGSRMFTATLEYRFPMSNNVQGIIFTDYGSAWSSGVFPKTSEVFGSVGVGVSLNTPLGPLRLDYGRGKQGGRFHFMVGGSF